MLAATVGQSRSVGSVHGQLDDERGAARHIVDHTDIAAVVGDDLSHDRQAKPRAVALAREVGDEQPVLVFGRDARTVIGHLDPDEDPIEALRREASEETGFEIEVVAETLEFHTEGVRALPAPETILLERIEPDHYHIDLIYFVRSVGGQARLAPDEHSEMRWFTHAELGSAELTNDVRVLGRRAIERMGSNGA